MFVRAALFRRLGGFPEVPILEDVLLSEKLRSVTRPALLEDAAVTDARKFLAMGVWRVSWRALCILARHQIRRPARAGAFFEDVR